MSNQKTIAEFQAIDLDTARRFADNNDSDFDDDFLSSLERAFRKYGILTDKQWEALTNIIEKWNMDL